MEEKKEAPTIIQFAETYFSFKLIPAQKKMFKMLVNDQEKFKLFPRIYSKKAIFYNSKLYNDLYKQKPINNQQR